MVEWRERGFVQDSDEDEDLSDGSLEKELHKDGLVGLQDAIAAEDQENRTGEEIARGLANPGSSVKPRYIEGFSPLPTSSLSRHDGVSTPAEYDTTHTNHDDFEDIDELQLDTEQSLAKNVLGGGPKPRDEELELNHHNDKISSGGGGSIDSSPLSQPPSSTNTHNKNSSHEDLSASTPVVATDSDALRPASQAPAPGPARAHGPIFSVDDASIDQDQTGRRTFRQRNPIQLHPYLLENEQYRQSLRARGLRPVAVASDERRNVVETQEGETQYQLEAHADESQSTVFALSTQSSPFSSPNVFPSRQNNNVSERASDEDELPTLAELLATAANGGVTSHNKRRKLTPAKNPSSTASALPQEHELPNPFDITTSPKHVGELPRLSVRKRRLTKFRVPKAYIADPLPTPLASSDAHRPTTDIIHVDSDQQSNTESDLEMNATSKRWKQRNSPRTGEGTPLRSPSVAPSEASFSESEQIQRASKRIKGVLPASWLRLDQQGQRRKPAPLNPLPLPRIVAGDSAPQRGVAQRIPSIAKHRKRGSQIGSPTMINILDDSDSSQSDASRKQAAISPEPTPKASNRSTRLWQMDTQDVEVEDFVDPMLPSATRIRKDKSSKKRQLRLTDAFERPPKSSLSNQQPKQSYSRSLDSSHRTQRGRRKAFPRLSIVDSVRTMPRTMTPDFVRLAVRQAKSQPNKGRHSPSSKKISLHVQEDTFQTQKAIARWKKGRIVHWKEYVASSYRAPPSVAKKGAVPLEERSNNRQGRLPSPQKLHTAGRVLSLPGERSWERVKSKDAHANQNQRKSLLDSMSIPAPADAVPELEQANSEKGQRDSATRQQKQSKSSRKRPGQLENLQTIDDEQHRESAFHRDLQDLDNNLDWRRIHQQRISNPLIERYFAQDGHHDLEIQTIEPRDGEAQGASSAQGLPTQGITMRRERKRRPKPLPPNHRLMRLESEELFPNEATTPIVDEQPPMALARLSGLGSFGTKYTDNYGVKPLPIGAYFHQQTFIGSGELHNALEMLQRDFAVSTGLTTFKVNDANFSLGPWTEEASEHMEGIFTHITESINLSCDPTDDEMARLSRFTQASSSISSALKPTVAYFAKSLTFLDSIDRVSFSLRTSKRIADLLDAITVPKNELTIDDARRARLLIRALGLLLVCSFENTQIANHPIVDPEHKHTADQIFRRVAITLAESLIDHGMPSVKTSITRLQHQENLEAGLRDDQVEVEALVILFHVLDYAKIPEFALWDVLSDALSRSNFNACQDAEEFENAWSAIFSIIPVLEFDSMGTARASRRFMNSQENWSVVKTLLGRLFDLYSNSSLGQAATINNYLRATLTRCFNLVNHWGWRKCEQVLGTIFDFFAKRNFALLYNEDSRGAPSFLEQLDQAHTQAIWPSDRSFDIFLKLLATGLFNMRKVYTSKKIKNIAWRFIPNHGRNHAKEHDLHEEDLDALRNHHNLLSVLYWASPTSFRLNVDLIRNLVDFQASHSEVCRLNVRTWANLVRFQLSVDEEASGADSFAAWFNSILATSMQQHEKARPEAENAATKLSENRARMTKNLLEATIANNEKQIEGVLTMALASMKDLLMNAQSVDTALRLFEKSTVGDILRAFNPKQRRFGSVINLTLDVYQSYFNLLEKKNAQKANQEGGDDSQDYGDWSLLDDIDEDAGVAVTSDSIDEIATESVQRLLSNEFGAENFFDETMLVKVVDTWVYICHVRVKQSKRDWSYYLDSQSSGSWAQLRDTEQTHKFAPYFFSSIVQSDKQAFAENPVSILCCWLTSLVERESMLKYQQLLTATLLNTGSEHPLLHNLPFARSKATQRCDISLADMRARRLSLLSTILSNMRAGLEHSGLIQDMRARREEFAFLLKQLMHTMKKNYLETLPSSSTRGAYVDFVQRVVEFLQQYTADICPIDKFFTDSTAFPLPATDPTYVVGRLKSYSLQLASPSIQKKLATFFQASCERAVVENHQTYLVGQLLNSVAESFESALLTHPSLRRFMLNALFPSYIESALSHDCGWVLAMPILEATKQIFDDLLYCFSMAEQATAESVTRAVTTVYSSLQHATLPLIANSVCSLRPHHLSTLTAIFNTVTSALTVLDYVHRSGHDSAVAISQIIYFDALSRNLSASTHHPLAEESSTLPIAMDVTNLRLAAKITAALPPPSFPDVSAYCRREVHDSLAKTWVKHDNRYFVLRGNARKEVLVHTDTLEDARANLLEAIADFQATINRLPAFTPLRLARR